MASPSGARVETLLFPDGAQYRGQLRHNLRDLLHRGDSVRWHCDFAASLCGASFVFIVFSAAIRIGLRRLGDIAAARSTANSSAAAGVMKN